MSLDVGRLVAAEAVVALAAASLLAAGAGRWSLFACLGIVGAALVWVGARQGTADLAHSWTVLQPVTVLPGGEPTPVCCTTDEFLIAVELPHEVSYEHLRSVVNGAAADDSQLSALEIYVGPDLTQTPRTTVALLWLDPVSAHVAVARRGGGLTGVLAALRAAACRLESLLSGATRLLSSEELACLMPPEHRTMQRRGEYGDDTLAHWYGAALSTPECRSLMIGFVQPHGSPLFDHTASARRAE